MRAKRGEVFALRWGGRDDGATSGERTDTDVPMGTLAYKGNWERGFQFSLGVLIR